MNTFRRDFLKLAGGSVAAATASTILAPGAHAAPAPVPGAGTSYIFNVKMYGAVGDGKTIDTPAINAAIEAASAAGGGTVLLPSGTYLCYSIRLKSNIALYLENGTTIVAADGNNYDAAEPNPWEKYQDYGHNHWKNSLIWGIDLHDIAILGGGLIDGSKLAHSSRFGAKETQEDAPGLGNKTIGLKSCHNVILRDFKILNGGHFGILATGVDNMTIDNLIIDTNRDGMDIDCCKNVRVTNCTVNSPLDDGICPKSSFALGYARATENLTISNCMLAGSYVIGSVIDGTWKKYPPEKTNIGRTGRIKCGTESTGGFKNITVTNCVFDGSAGIALETADGAQLEDVTFTGITMRDCTNTPIFLRICRRMRAPEGTPIGSIKRVILSNFTSYNGVSDFACEIMGIPGHMVEDVKISDMYLHHQGGGTAETAKLVPPEDEGKYPDPRRFGLLPAHGFFVRHAKNIEFSNIELAYDKPDARPAFWLSDVDGADFFRVKQPKTATAAMFNLVSGVKDFRVFASRGVKDTELASADNKTL